MKFRELEKKLIDDGWERVKVVGSHHHYKHKSKIGKVTVPKHSGDIPIGTCNAILKQAGLK